MSYTPPSGSAADFSWVGAPSYTPPSGSAADFSWYAPILTITAVGDGTLSFSGVGYATIATGGDAVEGWGVGQLAFYGLGDARHGTRGLCAGELLLTGTVAARHGVSVSGEGSLATYGSGIAAHPRYSVKGEVRNAGVLVNRTVRAYSRDTGELVGSQFTTVGRFDIHTGFAEHEYYVMPIDLDSGADDFVPPVANRVLSILAVD